MTSPVREEERRGDEVEGGRGAHKVPVGHVLHSGGLFIVIACDKRPKVIEDHHTYFLS